MQQPECRGMPRRCIAGSTRIEISCRAAPPVVIGDFNSSAEWAARHGPPDHHDLDERLRQEFGLVSAYHIAPGEPQGDESKPTHPTHYWRWKEASPFHLDYCYIPEAWAPAVTQVTVGTYGEWAETSDPWLLVVDVALPLAADESLEGAP